MNRFAIDTGPLVALFSRRDPLHEWAKETFESLVPPLFTCEAVLSEACFLGRDVPSGPDDVMSMVARGLIAIDFRLGSESSAVRKLMSKYADVPMSLADACLVRMTELDAELKIITFDEDFLIYRRHGRQTIPVVMP